MERSSSWRESLRGEKVFVERLLRGEKCSAERTAKETGASWRDSLRGETSPRRDVFKEIISLWRDSSRRDSLRGEPGKAEYGRDVIVQISPFNEFPKNENRIKARPSVTRRSHGNLDKGKVKAFKFDFLSAKLVIWV
jgi:hypothetical protein